MASHLARELLTIKKSSLSKDEVGYISLIVVFFGVCAISLIATLCIACCRPLMYWPFCIQTKIDKHLTQAESASAVTSASFSDDSGDETSD
eukprot:c40921_g1_i1.p2 GENE.c40921_g1_i1~~c40921_g1_i1.p2  ORF type:complete len:102 (+),score=20.68 c40921_g1_i1:36-308(+)